MMDKIKLCLPPQLYSVTALSKTNTTAIVIPHLEIRACDWSKSCHMTFSKSGYFPHKAILPQL